MTPTQRDQLIESIAQLLVADHRLRARADVDTLHDCKPEGTVGNQTPRITRAPEAAAQ